jgi:chromosome segregation ATPase
MIHKGLSNQKVSATTTTSKMAGKGKTMSKSRIGEPYHGKAQGDRVYNQMKQKMVENEKTVQALTSELKRLTGADGVPALDELFRQIQEKDSEINELRLTLQEEDSSHKSKEQAFVAGKGSSDELQHQIRELQKEVHQLEGAHIKLKQNSGNLQDLEMKLKGVVQEKESLEAHMRTLTEEPFFKREKGESTQQKILALEGEKEKTSKVLYSLVDEEQAERKRLQLVEQELQKLKGKHMHLKGENEKLKRDVSDGGNLHDMDVYKSLFKMDPKMYGKTIEDLSDPTELGRIAYLERCNPSKDPDDVKYLKGEINKLRHESKDFASELEKVQNLLKL